MALLYFPIGFGQVIIDMGASPTSDAFIGVGIICSLPFAVFLVEKYFIRPNKD